MNITWKQHNSFLFNFQNHPDILMLVQLLVTLSIHCITRAVNTTVVDTPNCLVMQGVTKPLSHSKLSRVEIN